MADVQLEKGYTKIANKLLEQTAKIKLSATQYRIIMVVWRYTYGFGRKMHELSISFICEATGCSKRQIERDLKDLFTRKILLQQTQKGKVSLIGFNKNYDEWIGEKATTDKNDGSQEGGTTDVHDGSGNIETTDTDDGGTTDIDDGTPPTDLTEVLPTSMTDKKESIKKNLKEKDLPLPQEELDYLVSFYEQNGFKPIGDNQKILPYLKNEIFVWLTNESFDEPADIIEMALQETLFSQSQDWRLTNTILERWKSDQLRTVEAVQQDHENFKASKQKNVVPFNRKGERNEEHKGTPPKRRYDLSKW